MQLEVVTVALITGLSWPFLYYQWHDALWKFMHYNLYIGPGEDYGDTMKNVFSNYIWRQKLQAKGGGRYGILQDNVFFFSIIKLIQDPV